MEKKVVLIVDKMHRSIGMMLEEIGWEADYRPTISRDEILSIVHQYQGLIVRSKTAIDKELIETASDLKFVGRAGAGLDQIDIGALEDRDIQLINAPEGNRGALGEHAIGMLLTLMHKINSGSNEVKAGVWNREANRGFELAGKTVGVFGFGYMGSSFAEKLSGFGCRVIAYDKYKEDFGTRLIQEVSLEHFQNEVEVLSIHVPLTSETRRLFDRSFLAAFPQLKFVINTSRGEVLALSDLLAMLEDGQILGAGLDVLENEKLDSLLEDQKVTFEGLASRADVVMTPHVAGWTHESYVKINEVIVQKMIEKGLALNIARTSKN